MKTIFTLLFVLLFSAIGFSQTNIPSKTTIGSISENKTFSINKVYPNPVKDFLNVELKTTVSGNFSFSLYNIMGVEVKVWEPTYVSVGEQLLNLDFSEFKSGVYIVRVTNGKKVISQVIKKI